ncbi:hypothetical protein J3A83DRAFT_455495 [Scleroderma citrinum]
MPSSDDFWSHELKGRSKSEKPIPCIDGDPARYNVPEGVNITAKTFRCAIGNFPKDCSTGFLTPVLPGPMTNLAFVPYVEMHSPHTGKPPVEIGNPGDVYIASSPLTSYIKITPEKWNPLTPGVLKAHPFLRSIAAVIKEGTVVWESFHSPRSPPLNAFTTKRTRPPSPKPPTGPTAAKRRRTGREYPASSSRESIDAPTGPRGIIIFSGALSCFSYSMTTVCSPLSPSAKTKRPTPDADTTSVHRPDRREGSNLALGRLPTTPSPQARLVQEQFTIESQGMKEKATCRDDELTKLREKVDVETSRSFSLSNEITTLRLALAAAESKHEEAENAESFSQKVITGLRQTMLREQALRLKLKKEHDEAYRVHARESAEMQAIVQNVKKELEQSVTAEETLRKEKKKLLEQLSEANTSKVSLERDLAHEHEKRFKLNERISQLEAELKKLLLESRNMHVADVESDLPLSIRLLEPLPIEIKTTLVPFIIAGTQTSF